MLPHAALVLSALPGATSREPGAPSKDLLLDGIQIDLELRESSIAVVIRAGFKLDRFRFGRGHNLSCSSLSTLGDLVGRYETIGLGASLREHLIGFSLGAG